MVPTSAYYELKTKIHNQLLNTMDLSIIEKTDKDQLGQGIKSLTERILKEEKTIPLNFSEREKLIQEIQDEVLGLGPLEPFMQDPTISDVLVNGCNHIYIERRGKLEPTTARFKDDAHLRKIIDKIVSAVGRRIDESSPMVDARLADGSRVNAIIPPLALKGSTLSIRRFAVDPLEMDDLLRFKTVSPEIAELLKGIIKARLNVLISGGTGTGKTTLLNVLSRFIPDTERIITIEDSAELQLKQEHVVSLETRPPNIEGKGEVTQRDLVRNSLRMRPDRIIVGEVRGGEVLDMLQAMNTGHEGSMTTLHANSTRDALARMENMILMAGMELPHRAIREQISGAMDLIVQLERLRDGSRKVTSITEVQGMEGDTIVRSDIFKFEQTGFEDGRVIGVLRPTGLRPRFMEKIEAADQRLPPSIFGAAQVFRTR